MYPDPIRGPSLLVPGFIVLIEDDYAPGSRSAEWGINDVRCDRAYTNRLKVETSSRFIGPMQVIGLSGVILGDTYKFPLYSAYPTETDNGSFATRIRAENVTTQASGNLVQWAVTIEYTPVNIPYLYGTAYLGSGIIDPTQRMAQIFWDEAKYEQHKVEDEDSPPKPYRNTVGDPLIDTPAHEESRPVLKFIRNEPTYDDLYASSWKDTTNEDEFLGYAPNTVKCRGIKGERFYDADWGFYWQVTYEFEFRVDDDGKGFTQRILNAGYRYLKGGAGQPVNILDANNQPTHDARALKQSGDLLGATDDPYYNEFVEFPPMTFADLNIPEDIFYLN
jgi:hypothetical protein